MRSSLRTVPSVVEGEDDSDGEQVSVQRGSTTRRLTMSRRNRLQSTAPITAAATVAPTNAGSTAVAAIPTDTPPQELVASSAALPPPAPTAPAAVAAERSRSPSPQASDSLAPPPDTSNTGTPRLSARITPRVSKRQSGFGAAIAPLGGGAIRQAPVAVSTSREQSPLAPGAAAGGGLTYVSPQLTPQLSSAGLFEGGDSTTGVGGASGVFGLAPPTPPAAATTPTGNSSSPHRRLPPPAMSLDDAIAVMRCVASHQAPGPAVSAGQAAGNAIAAYFDRITNPTFHTTTAASATISPSAHSSTRGATNNTSPMTEQAQRIQALLAQSLVTLKEPAVTLAPALAAATNVAPALAGAAAAAAPTTAATNESDLQPVDGDAASSLATPPTALTAETPPSSSSTRFVPPSARHAALMTASAKAGATLTQHVLCTCLSKNIITPLAATHARQGHLVSAATANTSEALQQLKAVTSFAFSKTVMF